MRYISFLYIFVFLLLLSSCFSVNQNTVDIYTQGSIPENENIQEAEIKEISIYEQEMNILEAYIDTNKYIEAKKYGLELYQKYPKDHRILSRLGRVYIKLTEYKKGLDVLLQASEIVLDQDINILFNIARAYNKLEDQEGARKYIDMILDLDPENERALTFFEEKQYEVGDPINRTVIEELYQDELNEIESSLEKHKLLQAKQVVNQILEVSDTPELREYIVDIYTKQGHISHSRHTLTSLDEADAIYREALKIYPEDEHVRKLYDHNIASKNIISGIESVNTILEDEARDNTEAKHILDSLAIDYPTEPSITFAYGKYYIAEGDYDRAVQYYDKADEQNRLGEQ